MFLSTILVTIPRVVADSVGKGWEKMKKKKILMISALIILVLIVGGLITFLQSKSKPLLIVTGTVLFQEQQPPHVSATYPVGYYLKAGALDRVYLNYEGIAVYLDRQIWARGYLETVLGADGLRRLPLLVVTQLTEPNKLPH